MDELTFISSYFHSRQTNLMRIWGQIATDQVERIEKQLCDWEPCFNAGNCNLQPSEINMGEIYCAKFSEDGKWYRARIMSSFAGKYVATFVDFGNVEVVSITDLRKLDPDLYKIPPQAYQFVLANVVPSDVNWSIDAHDLCSGYVYEEVDAAVVGDVSGVPAVKLYKLGTTRSLNQQLLDRGLATEIMHVLAPSPTVTLCDSGAVSPSTGSHTNTDDSMSSGYSYNRMTEGDDCDVVVVNVGSHRHFWINVVEHRRIGYYDDMVSALRSSSSKLLRELKTIDCISKGTMCLAENVPKGGFSRGLVLEVAVLPEDVYSVYFVDDGNTEIVPKSKVYELSKPYSSVSALAIRCCLNPSSLSELRLDEVVNTLVRLSKSGKVVKCLVEKDIGNDTYVVRLSNEAGNIFVGTSAIRYEPTTLEVGQCYHVKMANVTDPKDFYVCFADRGDSYEQLMNTLQAKYESYSQRRSLAFDYLPPEMPCVARCMESGRWFRCKIEIAVNENHYKVLYVDSGQSQVMFPKGIYSISKEFVELMPPRAIPCTLSGFSFSSLVSKKVTDEFLHMVEGKVLKMTVVDTSESGYLVNLIDYSVDPPCLVNMHLTYKLNKKLKKVTIPRPELDKIESIYITSFETPALFFGQLAKFSMDTVNKLLESIASYYGDLKSDNHVLYSDDLSHVGDYCCAPYSVDKMYYRAKVLHRWGGKVSVLFVDFGNQDVVDACDVKVLHQQFAVLPTFGIQCNIENMFTHVVGHFRDSVKTIFMDETIEVEILDQVDGVYSVNIVDSESNQAILNKLKMCGIERRQESDLKVEPVVAPFPKTLVVRFNEAVTFGGSEEQVFITYVKSPLQFWCRLTRYDKDYDAMLKQLAYIGNQSDAQNEVSLVVGRPCLAVFDSVWNRAVITEVQGNRVKVNYVDYGNDDVVPVNSLRSIPAFLVKLPKQAIECRMANIVETQFNADFLNKFESQTLEHTFVAKPQGTLKSGEHLIELFDSRGMNFATCFGLTPRLTSTGVERNDRTWQNDSSVAVSQPHSAVPVSVSSSDAAALGYADDDWDESGVNGVDSKMDNGGGASNDWKSFSSSNRRSNKDEGLSWRPNDRNGGPSRNDWNRRSSQNRDSSGSVSGDVAVSDYVDRGHSRFIPPRLQKAHATATTTTWTDRSTRNSDENHDSFKRNTRKFEYNSSNNSDRSVSRGEQEMRLKGVEILCGNETFRRIRVSYVVSQAQFYCQLLEFDAQFVAMNENLQSHYSTFGSSKAQDTWSIGSACCAKYSADDQWYRATIQKIDGNNASIYFVDYGNDEVVDRTTLKVLEQKFCKAPALALKCFLENVRSPNGDWTDEQSVAFEARVLDKVFTVRIVSQNSNGMYGVELYGSPLSFESSLNYKLIRERSALPGHPNDRIYKRLLCDGVKSPFVEMQLVVGQKENVFVSWVTSLGCFFCQFSSRKEEFAKFEAELMVAYSGACTTELQFLDPECTAACVALYREDSYSAWCRAVILSVETDNVYVHFVDYGNVGYVPKGDLRRILPNFKDIPMEAIRCQLFGVEPLEDEWPMLEGKQLEEFFQGTTVELVFHGTCAESNLVDLIIDDQSVADKLVEAALLAHVMISAVAPSSSLSPPEVYAECEELSDGFHEIEICTVHSPKIFWCRLASCGVLVLEISEELRTGDLFDLPSCPMIGLAVVCERGDDNLLCRAIITDRLTPTVFTVLFVDFGDVSAVEAEELKVCRSKLMCRSHMAFLCALTGLTEESEAIVNEVFTSDVVPGRQLMAHVDSKVFGVHFVTLFAVDNGVTNLNSQMGLESTVEYVCEITQRGATDAEAISTPGEKVEVILTSILSPKSFWVQKTASQVEITALSERLNATYADSYAEDLDEAKWTPGSLCVGLYSEDHMWYRASIISVSDDSLAVTFIDYGNEDTLPLVNVRTMTSEFSSILPFATHCTLDLPATLDISEASSTAFLEEVGYGEEVILAEFLRHTEDQYIVKLYDGTGNDLVSIFNLASCEATNVPDEYYVESVADEAEESANVEVEADRDAETDKRELTVDDVNDSTSFFEESDLTVPSLIVSTTTEDSAVAGDTSEQETSVDDVFVGGTSLGVAVVGVAEEQHEVECVVAEIKKSEDDDVQAILTDGHSDSATDLTEIREVATMSDREEESVTMIEIQDIEATLLNEGDVIIDEAAEREATIDISKEEAALAKEEDEDDGGTETVVDVATLEDNEVPGEGVDTLEDNEVPDEGVDTLKDNEVPGVGADTLEVSDVPGEGVDTLEANEVPGVGVDTLEDNEVPDEGVDTLKDNEVPGVGADTLEVSDVPGEGVDTLEANEVPGEGVDTLEDNEVPDEGVDMLEANEVPGEGVDTLKANEVPGVGVDTLEVSDVPGEGADTLEDNEVPGVGADTLDVSDVPGEGVDTLEANEVPGVGVDTLEVSDVPGEGADTLEVSDVPGEGADTLEVSDVPGEGADTLEDNEVPDEGVDMLEDNDVPGKRCGEEEPSVMAERSKNEVTVVDEGLVVPSETTEREIATESDAVELATSQESSSAGYAEEHLS